MSYQTMSMLAYTDREKNLRTHIANPTLEYVVSAANEVGVTTTDIMLLIDDLNHYCMFSCSASQSYYLLQYQHRHKKIFDCCVVDITGSNDEELPNDIEFLLYNGQMYSARVSETVSKSNAIKFIEYLFLHGDIPDWAHLVDYFG